MVKIPENIYKMTNDYVNKLKQKIPVEKVILFGSYVNGTNTKNSDIDLAIFSPYFENMSRIDGLTFLLTLALDYKIDLQPQPYTIKDYFEPTGLMSEIIKTGIEI